MSASPSPHDIPDLDAALAKLGFDSFRPGQREAIEILLTTGRLLLVAPTGGGKSLTYQLPASLLPGTTLVISPLIALMSDQVRALEQVGIPSTYLASTLNSAEMRERLRGISEGRYKIVYASPERLTLPGFRALLQQLDCPLVAIDEAHCISEWGHDFRPEYMRINEVLTVLPNARIMACTATATPIVRDEILGRLGLAPDTPQVLKGFARPNLGLNAIDVPSKKERIQHTDALLVRALGAPGAGAGTAIIYGPTRKSTHAECERLQAQGWDAAAYHAGLSPKERDTVQARFQDGELEVVVATNAFGMGIDRSDVRAVIHLASPGSIEAYYQEGGRAGRDGEDAYGLLLTSASDLPRRRHLLESPTDGVVPRSEVIEHKWNLFLELMRWAEGGTCRHDSLLRYFGDEAESLDGCGRCDVCTSLHHVEERTPEEVELIVRKALSGVARIHNRLGLSAAVTLLKGKEEDRLTRNALTNVSTFGILKEFSEEWLLRLLRRFITAGWVNFVGGDRPLAVLTEAGIAVMKGERAGRILLPPPKRKRGAAPRRSSSSPGTRVDADFSLGVQALFDALREYRLEQARLQGVPPYFIASDRTLRDVAMLKPRNLPELLQAHGIGPGKAEKYGAGFLQVVSDVASSP